MLWAQISWDCLFKEHLYLVDLCLEWDGENLRVEGEELVDGELLNLRGNRQELNQGKRTMPFIFIQIVALTYHANAIQSRKLKTRFGARNQFQDRVWNWVAKLHRLAGQYDNPMPSPHSGTKVTDTEKLINTANVMFTAKKRQYLISLRYPYSTENYRIL